MNPIELKRGDNFKGLSDYLFSGRKAVSSDVVLAKITAQKSVFSARDIRREVGSNADVARVLAADDIVLLESGEGEEQLYSTREMIELERSMTERVQAMSETSGHGVRVWDVEGAIARANSVLSEHGAQLSSEQVGAIEGITGNEQIAVVSGLAGAGKSTMLAAAREAWEAQGYRVRCAALSGKAAEGLQEASGIESRTLASYERGWSLGYGELQAGDVFVVDEAGMVGSRQLAGFVAEAEERGAKVVLVGDEEQLQAINGGSAFRAIADRLSTSKLKDVRRQKESWQREASKDFAAERTTEALEAYDARGTIRFEETTDKALSALVRDCVDDTLAHPETSRIALAHRRVDIRELNQGIRDWEISRLRVAINSHLNCTMAEDVEVVVSDYGSENHTEVEKLATELGCTYVYTDDELWSRSRALNAGIVASNGEFILGTDADIIFAPETHAITVDYLRKYPQSLQLKQCRDLPESVTLNDLETVDWAYLDSIARTRPQWGMGGLAACRRDLADKVRGYDERMVVWGAEDNDFGKRLRASGAILNWMTDKAAQIYHVWHPPFLKTHPDANEIFERNKKYLNEDPGIIRNLHFEAIYRGIDPIVSVVIATKNRADYLRASIQSVLNQSFREFELIVIDDGSEDDTQDVLKSFTDPRIKRMRNETSLGVGGSRNKANATARGHYIAVHDDDDLMLPKRLEQQLGMIQAGVQGAYGGWVDFDNDTSDAAFRPGKQPFGIASLCFSSAVLLHPTLMAEKALFKLFPYHDSFLAGSDYNVAFRMAWNAVRFEHCGAYVTMRRIHSANMTSVSATTQKASSLVTTSVFLNGLHKNLENELRKDAKAVKEIAIDLSPQSLAEMMRLVPCNGVVEVINLPPGPVGSYHGDEELVLGGRLIKGELQLDFEWRNGEHLPLNQEDESREEVEGTESPVQRHVTSFVGLSFVREEDDIDVPEVYGRVAASVLSQKENWTVLHINERGKLSDALEKTQHLLPPDEEFLFICRKGTWMAAFENQPGLRGTVLARKLSISNVNGEFHTIQVVSK